MKIVVEQVPGNLYDAAAAVNRQGAAEYVVGMQLFGSYTFITFRAPDDFNFYNKRKK